VLPARRGRCRPLLPLSAGALTLPALQAKEDMPAEHLRKIIKDHGDMSSRKVRVAIVRASRRAGG